MLRPLVTAFSISTLLLADAVTGGPPPADACGYGATFSMTDLVTDAALADQVALRRESPSVHRVLSLNFATGQARVGVRWTERDGRVVRGQVLSLARAGSGAWAVVARTRPFRVWT